MYRLNRLLRLALPFEPMALTTLEQLEARLGRVTGDGAAGRLTGDSCEWFDAARSGGAPFFVSPKHDGIRMVSYVHTAPAAAKKGKTRPSSAADDKGGVSAPGSGLATTAFSRHGRPLYGLFWLEKELALLRALAADPCLVLDGELYMHRVVSSTGGAGDGDGFKTGFLAVSALAHRLRGSTARHATVGDILQYVSSLPNYCVFDVAAYSPANAAAALPGRDAGVAAELARVRQQTARDLGVTHLETLRCTPNVTPFSQRLRTARFLAELLERGCASPALQRAFGVHEKEEVAAASTATQPTPRPRRAQRQAGDVVSPADYRGGVFVKMVPYDVVGSLQAAKTSSLAAYERLGYEGVVIRSPTNTYEMREKRRGTVRDLVGGGSPSAGGGPRRGRGADIFKLGRESGRGGRRGPPMVRTYLDEGDSVLVEDDSPRFADLAVARVARLSPRSATAVKLLPFKDKEYLVLRPLLKEPSTNPRTRPLVAISRSALGAADPSLVPARGKKAGGDSVVFYGLQCLAENGKVFNVTLPKLSTEKQQQLLSHLLASTRRAGRGTSAEGRRGRSMAGTYVTVKFASLTEHGVPRFAQVKAIRGGKGWHL